MKIISLALMAGVMASSFQVFGKIECSESQLLKSYAVSQCIARAYPNTEIAKDAKAASGGYLEFGSADVDAYGEVVGVAEKALKKQYVSESGRSLEVMKCIDLMFSPELEEVVHRRVERVQ